MSCKWPSGAEKLQRPACPVAGNSIDKIIQAQGLSLILALQDGSRNNTEGGGRKLNENKLLGKKSNRYSSAQTLLLYSMSGLGAAWKLQQMINCLR